MFGNRALWCVQKVKTSIVGDVVQVTFFEDIFQVSTPCFLEEKKLSNIQEEEQEFLFYHNLVDLVRYA